MVVVKTYIAEDGTHFDTEWECADYESKLRMNAFKDTALLFDIHGQRLPLKEKNFEAAYYIKALTDEAAEYMAELASGWENPWGRSKEAKAGFWVYIGDEWTPAKTILDMAEIINRI